MIKADDGGIERVPSVDSWAWMAEASQVLPCQLPLTCTSFALLEQAEREQVDGIFLTQQQDYEASIRLWLLLLHISAHTFGPQA